MVGLKYFKGEKYTKYNKLNNNSEKLREGKIAARGIRPPWPTLVAGLVKTVPKLLY